MSLRPDRRFNKKLWLVALGLMLLLTPCTFLPPPVPPAEESAETWVGELQANQTTLPAGGQTEIRVATVRVLSDEGPPAYQWSTTGGTIANGQGTCCVTYHAPEIAGTYEIRLAVQYSNQLVQRAMILEVTAPPTVPPTLAEPTPLPTLVISTTPTVPPPPTEAPLADATAYFERGLDYYFKRDNEHAIADFTQAIELNYDPLSEPYYQRGFVYYTQGNYQPAIEDLSRAIELNYDPIGQAYYNRGNAYYYLGRNDEAIADYTQALELEYEPASWLYNSRGLAYRKAGAYDEAIADYTQAIELKHEPLHWPYYNRANAYADKGAYEQAIVDYNEAITLDPNLVEAYYARGLVYKQLGDTVAALTDFNQVIQLDNDYWRSEAEKQLQELSDLQN